MITGFRKNLIVVISAAMLFGAFSLYADAAFNEQINYQGKLTDDSNAAVSDGSKCIKFRLMDAVEGGNELWSEEWDSATQYATTSSGLFSVMLGSNSSLSGVNFDQTLYLEVQYDPGCDDDYEEVFAPRKVVGAVPAAFEAKRLAGYTWEAPDAIGSSTPSTASFTTISASGAFTTSNGSILTSASGLLTLGGTGGTHNENLTVNFDSASNYIVFSTTTSATDLNFISLNLSTAGTGTFGSLSISPSGNITMADDTW
ncbi:MAG: hypothetical protein PHI53_02260, partial [Candidatus Pacebacteria bacterium]|nr:hypothetical protein [Candidatus Paceibacterota bacterium]